MRDFTVAVVGAGPAGVYVSDILLRQIAAKREELGLGEDVTAHIDLFEKLPVPFGLVRYGVAPDHPAIKFIIGALEKTLNNPQIRLMADVEFGRDIQLEDLTQRYDAVIFATGAVDDRPLEIPGAKGAKGSKGAEGAHAANVFGAARFVEWYDGYPTAPAQWPLEAREVAVLGGGNVAMDISRLLVRYPDDLLHTDIPQNVYDGLAANKAEDVHVFVRRDVTHAKFSVQELRELEALPGVEIVTYAEDFSDDVLTDAHMAAASEDKLTRQMVDELLAVRAMSEKMMAERVDFEGQPARRRFHLHFNANPLEIVREDGADGAVQAVRIERTVTDASGVMRGTGEVRDVPVQAVYHAIGYKPAEIPGIPYDEAAYTLDNEGGRIAGMPFVYATGWAKRGPVGLIGSTKSDALETVENVLADWAASEQKGRVAALVNASDSADSAGADIAELLAERGVQPLDYAAWQRVDAYERALGAAAQREHIKVISEDELRAIARGEKTAPSAQSAPKQE
ncbi:FAD-dependent oxidoreductase [Alloscardovia macacae]|uniref:ferredoxin--NADP(+) reductase n=1 Tax=Alloscardovia macacae TaxID=1160091 RepID=A0A261F4P5_9BIFI|nr:FAD-dependent oxidoreductase [Alloscardovia macacae]OZG54074.1 glutamate synthase [Alloscardovia macacae]